jgi:hypothetical protein
MRITSFFAIVVPVAPSTQRRRAAPCRLRRYWARECIFLSASVNKKDPYPRFFIILQRNFVSREKKTGIKSEASRSSDNLRRHKENAY